MAIVERRGATLDWWRAVLALLVSLSMQVAVNFANDYSDGVRGTDDTGLRVGPVRLVGWKLAAPSAVRNAALLSFAIGGAAGLVLAAVTSWWILVLGASAVVAAWGYTGGPRPYGYEGLGEVFVFVYFGPVAVMGTTFVLIERLSLRAAVASIPVGLLAVALLIVNNLRDIPGDTIVKKRTLAVRLGDRRTRRLYVGVIAVAFASVPVVAALHTGQWAALVALGAAPLALPPVRAVLRGTKGRDLIAVLVATARLHLGFGLALAVGLIL